MSQKSYLLAFHDRSVGGCIMQGDSEPVIYISGLCHSKTISVYSCHESLIYIYTRYTKNSSEVLY